MRKVFQSTVWNALFEKNGYVVVPLLPKAQIEALLKGFEASYAGNKFDQFFTTTHHPSYTLRETTNRLITDQLNPLLQPLLHRHLPLYANFMIKDPGETDCGLHQDWTFVDETRSGTINVWVALDDTVTDNGCIHVVPGSHRYPFRIRGRNLSMPYAAFGEQIMQQLGVPVPLKSGEAVIFDSSVIHYSPPNITGKRRHAASLMFYPEGELLMHYRLNPATGRVERYQVDEAFFLRFSSAEDIQGMLPVATLSPPDTVTDFDKFLSLVASSKPQGIVQ